jgi:hypothetical protein
MCRSLNLVKIRLATYTTTLYITIKFELTMSFGKIILHEICFLIAPSIEQTLHICFLILLQLSRMEIDIFSHISLFVSIQISMSLCSIEEGEIRKHISRKKQFIFHFAREKVCSICFYTRKILLNLLNLHDD